MKLIPVELKKESSLHIEKIREEMRKDNIPALLIAGNANLYYSTCRFFRGYIFVSLESEPVWFVIKPSVFEKEDYFEYIRKPENIPSLLTERDIVFPSEIGIEENELSYSDVIRLKALFPKSNLVNASPILKKSRMVKTEWEINEMIEDGIHQCNVYAKVKDCYKPGMSDLGLQIEIEKQLRLEGSLGVSRVAGNLMEINLGSVISGDNADNPGPYEFTMGGSGVHPALPVGADNSTILQGHTVMIDMNGAFNGYQTDMTRVWALGDISDLAQRAHDCSCRILNELQKKAIPGVPVRVMYEIAEKIVAEANLSEYFMGHRSQASFIGHGVGIELNELPVINPRSKDILEAGMTIAIEPKFVIPHVGAVGVENTYVVTDTGLKNITVFPEKIEKF